MPHPPTTALEEDEARPSPRQPDRPLRLGARTHDAPESTRSDRPNRAITARRLSIASAALILVGGYVHYCLYMRGYAFIPKIGVSFLLQATASVVLALALLVQDRRIHQGGHAVAVAQLTRLCAIGLSVGTLAALGIAHTQAGLFQFREIGLQPAPQTIIAIVVESIAALLLTVAVLERWAAARTRSPAPAVAASTRRPMREAA
jgi:hypothetical protein